MFTFCFISNFVQFGDFFIHNFFFHYSIDLQLRADARFNLIVTRILAQYISFRARKTAANKSLSKEQIHEICYEIWQQMDSFVGLNFSQRILILLRTDPKDYKLCVVLYHLFEWTHQLILRQQRQTLPEVLVIILVVLFYKHWLQMFTATVDKKLHTKMALTSLEKFGCLPRNFDQKFNIFIRMVDDRFYHAYLGKWTIWYVLFGFQFLFVN